MIPLHEVGVIAQVGVATVVRDEMTRRDSSHTASEYDDSLRRGTLVLRHVLAHLVLTVKE